jgi:hypothetical protein
MSFISSETSVAGRRQFSVEKPNTVSHSTPKSAAVSTVRFRALTPARWPKVLGRPRALAQRPFPSMMMATCRAESDATVWPDFGDMSALLYPRVPPPLPTIKPA